MNDRRLDILHFAVIIGGFAILLANVFHGNVWYDETYSVAIAWHPFDEIWRIGAKDVHPVLYYFFLRFLYLAFGTNIVAYRLFTVVGALAFSLLGWTHVRRDTDQRTGIAFSLFAYFLPWCVRIDFQIRMYTWLAVVVMLAFIYAWRILRELRDSKRSGCVPSIPWHWWVLLFACSAMSAYLHYYGAMAAFTIQVSVIAGLVWSRCPRKLIVIWLIGALVAVACYVPWLSAAASQAKMASGGSYWIHFTDVGTTGEILKFPFDSPEIEFMPNSIALISLTMAVCLVALFSYGKALGSSGAEGEGAETKGLVLRNPASYGLAIFVGTGLVVMAASVAIQGAVLYYRYLTVCLGPLALAMAYVLTKTASRKVGYLAIALCLACGAMAYYELYEQSHSPKNDAVFEMYADMHDRAKQMNGGEEPLVIGTSVYTDGILATGGAEGDITYIPEYDIGAYEAYEPKFIRGKSFNEVLTGHKGAVLLLANEEIAQKLAQEYGGEVVAHDYAYHEYSSRWFDFCIIDFK